MSKPGRAARQARAAIRAETQARARAEVDARHELLATVIHDVAREAGVDLDAIMASARRRVLQSHPPAEQHRSPTVDAQQQALDESRDALRGWLGDYLAAATPVFERFRGNPVLFAVRPVSVDISEAPVPGMTGGADPPHHAFWTSACPYSLDGGPNHSNEFHPYLMLDNGDDQHVPTDGSLQIVLHYEIDPPEEDWFLGDRVWAPLMGHGIERFFPGWPRRCGILLNTRGCFGDTMLYDIRVDQPGSSYTNYDVSDPSEPGLDYVRIRSNSYCGGTAERSEWARTEDRVVFPDIGAFMYEMPGLLLKGVEQGGRPIGVDVSLTLRGSTYYEGEFFELDFRAPNWITVPFVAIHGRDISL